MIHLKKGDYFDFGEDISSAESMGKKTQRLLIKKGVISPELINRIQIHKGIWIVPKKLLKTEKQIEDFIAKQRKKFKYD